MIIFRRRSAGFRKSTRLVKWQNVWSPAATIFYVSKTIDPMPALFNRLGISFQYPENWTLDDSDAILGRRSVTVFSPGGAFWSVTMQTEQADPEKLSEAVVDSMKQEYGGLEADAVEETIADHTLHGYDLAFICLDLTNTAQVRSCRVAHTTYTIYCQAEDREYRIVQRVFEAMTLTLLQSLTDTSMREWE
jgi:hypothetical protein